MMDETQPLESHDVSIRVEEGEIVKQTQAEQIWGLSPQTVAVAKNMSQLYKIKHGMFAGVPIICKGHLCPYAHSCRVEEDYRIVGDRCPQEIGAIMARYDYWCKHFKVKTSGEVDPADAVDLSLIRDLVENEIQTLRAENKIAISGDFVARVIGTVDQKGNAYYEDALSPESQYKLQLQDRRYKILNLLNSTRKDKAGSLKPTSPSMNALSVISKLREMVDLTDVDFSEERTD